MTAPALLMLPREPDAEMLAAVADLLPRAADARDIYRTMVASWELRRRAIVAGTQGLNAPRARTAADLAVELRDVTRHAADLAIALQDVSRERDRYRAALARIGRFSRDEEARDIADAALNPEVAK